MAVTVIFTSELVPLHVLTGTMWTDAVVAFNSELAAFFDGKVGLVPGYGFPKDCSNVVRAEKCYAINPAVEGHVWLQGSVAAGFDLDDVAEARRLAESFTSATFPYVLVDALEKDEVVDTSKPYVPPSVRRQIQEHLVKYGSADERAAREANATS